MCIRDRYSTVTSQLALDQAKESRERAKLGTRLSSLDGVPISWKDLFDIKGYPCEAGSELLAGRYADKNCEVYKFAEAQGLICLGKTHMSELAFSGLGLNPIREKHHHALTIRNVFLVDHRQVQLPLFPLAWLQLA